MEDRGNDLVSCSCYLRKTGFSWNQIHSAGLWKDCIVEEMTPNLENCIQPGAVSWEEVGFIQEAEVKRKHPSLLSPPNTACQKGIMGNDSMYIQSKGMRQSQEAGGWSLSANKASIKEEAIDWSYTVRPTKYSLHNPCPRCITENSQSGVCTGSKNSKTVAVAWDRKGTKVKLKPNVYSGNKTGPLLMGRPASTSSSTISWKILQGTLRR